ncbi:MAG: glycosyltransferase [Ferruginibacter sp.]
MISAIIPVFNEAEYLADTLHAIRGIDTDNLVGEIIICDAGSTDDSVAIARKSGATVIISTLKGRAAQMNAGAAKATSTVLYFLHADTWPSAQFSRLIKNAIEKGFGAGCFVLSFDH